jgi:large subunit ribosomal protein L17
MFANMTTSLIRHERIKTTVAKAKELRRVAERTITWATSLGDVLTTDREQLDEAQRAKLVHHMRMARRVVKDREALVKLFEEVAPRFVGRPGGYTRIVRFSENRRGDGAPMALVELLAEAGSEESESETESEE